MSTGRDINYKNGVKNQWRNWVWKAISKKVGDKKTAKVLYLSAAQDLDRAVASRNGFNVNNMIAVDNDRAVVRRLRQNGVNVVYGDFFEVAHAGLDYFDVVYADLCCGLEPKVLDYVTALTQCQEAKKVVLALNLQRGRDRLVTKIRNIAKERGYDPIGSTGTKNRAEMCAVFLKNAFADQLLGIFPGLIEHPGEVVAMVDNIFSSEYRSYRARRVDMDSCVVLVPEFLARTKVQGKGFLSGKARLAAAKAVMTMRMKGTLPPPPRW